MTLQAQQKLERINCFPDYLRDIDAEFEEAFNAGKGKENVYFLHFKDVGIFVCVLRGSEVTAHPLIAPNARGKAAIDAGKEVVAHWFNNGATRLHTRCGRDLKHAMVYNCAVGLRRYAENDKYIFYEVRK